jgi:hypothetical protein
MISQNIYILLLQQPMFSMLTAYFLVTFGQFLARYELIILLIKEYGC